MKFISQEKIPGLLETLAAAADVWAPRELNGSGGTVMFERWRSGDPVDMEHFSVTSAKDVVLPRTEKLFGFNYAFGAALAGANPNAGKADSASTAAGDAAGGESPACGAVGSERVDIQAAPAPPDSVLFGARACDARALTVLDALFNLPAGESYNDPYYRARRAGLTVITLACTSCDDACFCSSFGDGPAEKSGSDVILYPLEGGFLAEAVSDKGGKILTAPLFEESDREPPELAVTATVEGIAGLEKSLPAIFADLDFWQRLTEKCISCGFCTHGCPTCYCFNIHDEMRGDREGERLRSWDACRFYQYTQETSGHNPRPTLAPRYRNRINHKFSYFPENQGEILCTGCGRCIRGCPVGLDIRDVLRAALEYQGSDGEDQPGSAPEPEKGEPI